MYRLNCILRSLRLARGVRGIMIRDCLGLSGRHKVQGDHLSASIAWLKRSQEPGGGLRGWYDLFGGWSPPYPEITGYAVPTFLRAGCIDEARRCLDWLLTVQMDDGSFPGGVWTGRPQRKAVFNTGQILQGLDYGYRHFREQKYLDAAIRAADWLCHMQDDDGAWRKHAYNDTAHSYYTRVSWPLAEFGRQVGENRHVDAAARHRDWAKTQWRDDGWIEAMEMHPGRPAVLHPIAYTLEGMWNLGLIAGEKPCLQVVERSAEVLRQHAMTDGLAGEYTEGFRQAGDYLCLTGCAQMCIVWLAIYRHRRDTRFLDVAVRVLDRMRGLQDLTNPAPEIHGGIRGSYPLTGAYMQNCIVNWGAKFFVDALLDERECLAAD